MALSYGQPWWWDSFGQLIEAVRTGRRAFDVVYGESLFAYLGHQPAAGIFNANTAAATTAAAAAVADAYSFDG